jgi:6-pyruvoyltetrahydropterin/6-carboxytetrahydropterin synthase
MTNTIQVSHNMEVAHRLSLLPGKCQNIHGHSMQVRLTLSGLSLNENGIAGGIDFSSLKKLFRNLLDSDYDHHLHLNRADVWAQPIFMMGEVAKKDDKPEQTFLPGLILHDGDPTVENLAKRICGEMCNLIINNQMIYGWVSDQATIQIDIEETKTNGASWVINLNKARGRIV